MKRRFGPWVAALLLCAAPAVAISPAIHPTESGPTGYFTLYSGQNAPDGEWTFSLYYNNWDRIIEANNEDLDFDVDWHRLSLSAGYAITDRFELSASLPYEDFTVDNTPGDFGDRGSGLGNFRVNGKWQFAGDDISGAGVTLFVEAPTGDKDVASDDPGFGAVFGWNNANWLFNVGYREPGDYENGERRLGDDAAVAEWLLELAHVAVVPGGAFGAPGHLRLSYAVSVEQIDDALARMARAAAQLA